MLREAFCLVVLMTPISLASAGDRVGGWSMTGAQSKAYSIQSDPEHVRDGQPSVRLESKQENSKGFGALVQAVSAKQLKSLRGNKVKFTAHVKTEGVKEWAGLWMRIDGANGEQLAFDNMHQRPISGDTPWKSYNIVLTVPDGAQSVFYGLLLQGTGQAWIDSGSIEVIVDENAAANQHNGDLTGRVLDKNGKGLNGATVTVTVKTFGPFRWNTLQTKTKQGTFTFPGAYPKDVKSQLLITVYAEGYAMTSHFIDDGDSIDELVLRPDPGMTKTFYFMDENAESLVRTSVVPTHRITPDGVRHQMYFNATRAADVMTDDFGRCTLSRFTAGDEVRFIERGGAKRSATVKIDPHPSQHIQLTGEGQPTKPDLPTPEPVDFDPDNVRWLADNAIQVRSIDPADTDFSDLQGLKQLIGDAKIVGLGEQSHGDGACFETKIRLVKFLHQEMGFDVLAFESGLYDCHRAWQAFEQGTPGRTAARQGVFGIWTESAQTAELWKYLAQQVDNDTPLELAGFDCQFTAGASSKYLADDIRQLAKTYAPRIDSARIESLIDRLPLHPQKQSTTRGFEQDLQVIDDLQLALERAVDEGDSQTVMFWKQNLKSIKQHCLNESRQFDGQGLDMRRDEQMADNLVWLSNQLYPDRKIIVWAASFHLMRNPSQIEVLGGRPDYRGLKQMGHYVHQQLGDQFFTIAFTAYDGTAGSIMAPSPFQIAKPPAGTLEDLFQRAGLTNAVVSLNPKAERGRWLTNKFHARPLGYAWMEAIWHRHFDAMFFNKTMRPSTGK